MACQSADLDRGAKVAQSRTPRHATPRHAKHQIAIMINDMPKKLFFFFFGPCPAFIASTHTHTRARAPHPFPSYGIVMVRSSRRTKEEECRGGSAPWPIFMIGDRIDFEVGAPQMPISVCASFVHRPLRWRQRKQNWFTFTLGGSKLHYYRDN